MNWSEQLLDVFQGLSSRARRPLVHSQLLGSRCLLHHHHVQVLHFPLHVGSGGLEHLVTDVRAAVSRSLADLGTISSSFGQRHRREVLKLKLRLHHGYALPLPSLLAGHLGVAFKESNLVVDVELGGVSVGRDRRGSFSAAHIVPENDGGYHPFHLTFVPGQAALLREGGGRLFSRVEVGG